MGCLKRDEGDYKYGYIFIILTNNCYCMSIIIDSVAPMLSNVDTIMRSMESDAALSKCSDFCLDACTCTGNC